MVKNINDKWGALSMSERASLINTYVQGGVLDLNKMKEHYNSFSDGGDTQNHEEKSLPGNWLQRLAYKFGSDPEISSKGIATVEDIKRVLKSSEDINWNELDNNKATYLFGNILGLYPVEGTNGKDYSWYLKKEYPLKHVLGKIKEYEGTINPFNEYVIDSRDKGLIEELAKKGKGLYSNSDIEYEYMWDAYDKPPYKEDVANYHMQFVNTPNGPAVSASDLYDFGNDYNPNDYDDNQHNYNKLLTDLQVKAFSAVGTPYIYRQDNVPIKFVDTTNNYSEEATRAKQLSRALRWANLSEKDLSEGVTFDEKLANILETGYIEPSVVTAKKSYGDRILDGTKEENLNALGGPLYNKHNPIESFSGSSKIPVVRAGNNVFKDGGDKTKGSRNITPEERVEYTMRKSKGITGKWSEISSYPTLISMYNAFSTEEVPSEWSVSDAASPEDSYTGTLMLGAKNKTENELGFSTPKELTEELGYTPVDFVKSYATGKTPFEELGVIKKGDQGEVRLLRKSIQGRDVPIYQTHKDTLSAKDLDYLYKELEKGFPKKGDNTYTTNSTHKNSPYKIGDSNIYYDGNNHQIVHIKLPDGKTAFKAVDYYDFNPDNWNYKVLPGTKKFLSYLDDHGNPFVVTSPWYLEEDTRSLSDRLLDYGIILDESGKVHHMEGYDGKAWTLEEAITDIENKKYF